jgi:hypothetical protein
MDAPDRAAYKPNTFLALAWRARNLSQKTSRSLLLPLRAPQESSRRNEARRGAAAADEAEALGAAS